MNILDSPEFDWQNEDMAWAIPQYPRSRVDWAGRVLVAVVSPDGEQEEALRVVNNWRASHSFPLNTFQMTLRNKVQQVDPRPLIAQRLKRLPSISYKLRRFPSMALSQMQDIGGCRGVVSSIAKVRALRDLYHESDLKHHLVREKDYIANPKPDGYRSIHLVYRYMSDRKDTYNRLQIEMQLRSSLQHAWATAVETVGTFLQQALKASHGSEEWLRFFALMGSAIAHRERTPIVPGTPPSKAELVREIKHYVRRLDVERKLRVYGQTLQTLERRGQLKEARYFLLEVRPSEGKATIYGFAGNQLDQATKMYLNVEQELEGPGSEAVLVSVDSLASLKRAYPSYFLDTDAFLQAMQAAII